MPEGNTRIPGYGACQTGYARRYVPKGIERGGHEGPAGAGHVGHCWSGRAELAAVDDALTELVRTDPGDPCRRPHRRSDSPSPAGPASARPPCSPRCAAVPPPSGCTVLSARGGDQEQRRRLPRRPPAAAAAARRHRRGGTPRSWAAGTTSSAPRSACAPRRSGAPPDPQGLRDGLDWVLTHLAVQRAPMVLVLDDAHWADPESLGWLAAFAPRAEELPLLLVVAYRPEELPDHADAFRGLPGGRAGARIDLEPLTAGAVGRLVRDDARRRTPTTRSAASAGRSPAGNPFEAVELTAKVRDRGLEPDRGPRRTCCATSPPPSRAAAWSPAWNASAPPPSASPGPAPSSAPRSIPPLAAAVAGLGHEEAADAADALRGARILTAAADRALEFVHPLIATAVYRAIPGAAPRRPARPGRLVRRRRRTRLRPPPPATSWRPTPTATPGSSSNCAPPPARPCAPAPPTPPAAASPAPCANPRPRGPGRRPVRTGLRLPAHRTRHHRQPSAGRPRGAHRRPRPARTASSTGSPRSSPTATASPRPPTPSPARSA